MNQETLDYVQGKEIEIVGLSLYYQDEQVNLLLQVIANNEKVSLQFEKVSRFNISNLSYPMVIQGLEILDNSINGWDAESRYRVHDFEEDSINFFCQNINLNKKLGDG